MMLTKIAMGPRILYKSEKYEQMMLTTNEQAYGGTCSIILHV